MIYIAKCQENEALFKVGYSLNPEKRIQQYSTVCGVKFIVVEKHTSGTSYDRKIEGMFHKNFRAHSAKLQSRFGREVYYSTLEDLREAIYAQIEEFVEPASTVIDDDTNKIVENNKPCPNGWRKIADAPQAAYERWQIPVRLLLRCDGQPTIGYRERMRSGKTRWRTIVDDIVDPEGWLPIPE